MATTKDSAGLAKRPRLPASTTYELCRELIDQGMPVTESFAVIGQQTGRATQTIQSAYYAHQRRLSGEVVPSRTKAPRAKRQWGRRTVSNHLRSVEAHIDAQDRRIRELEDETAHLRREARSLRDKATKYDAMIAAGR
jgi:hypothetical protein